MSAIENCRTAALGGHVAAQRGLCPRGHRVQLVRLSQPPLPVVLGRGGQSVARRAGIRTVAGSLLSIPLVSTLPAAIADIAYHNKATVYDRLFKASSETLITIAADPKLLGARAGAISVPHTWGSAMTDHPHVHVIAPGGGLSLDGGRCVACRPGFFLRVRSLAAVPSSLPRKTHGRLRRRLVAILWSQGQSLGARRVHGAPRRRCARLNGSPTPSDRSVRPCGRSGSPSALHPSRRHRQ